jgi:hypothetical protein
LFSFVLTVAAGCGITPDSLPAQHPVHHPSARQQPAAHPQRASRFADIGRAQFFSEPRPAVTAAPLAPAPASSPNLFAEFEQRTAISACRPHHNSGIQQVQNVGRAPGNPDDYNVRPPVNDPRKLKKITEIEPYTSYEPNPLVRAQDPCENLCPRPDGAPCKDLGDQALACPDEVVLSNELYIPRCFDETIYAWEASNIYYNPLYFEDVALERYGHTYPCCVQPFASVGKFGVQLVGLPYQMAIDPPWKRIYPLGYYRPGECAPKLHYQIPWNTRAALVQAGVTTGMFYLIP